MIHLPALIQDLALILMSAAAMTLLCRAIRQPVVLGYIVAGFFVGHHFPFLPNIADPQGVKVWAEIGVIFLLFALGLEFSFKKLARVGGSASVTAVIEVIGMVGIGYLVGRAFGWPRMDALFLGGILAISSTTIIIRAFEELGLKSRGFVKLVFGVLIIEDLVAILLMVILSTVAVSQTFSGVEMGMAALKLGFFLTLWFVLGIFLIPTFLKRARRWMPAETLLVVSLGLCFAMVAFATHVGFSPALGAFIMGSILSETAEGERIEHLILPVKDLFAAVFFVSVGMLIEPEILAEYAFPIMIITVATITGKFLTTTLGALVSGQSLRHSVQAGMSLAQIGEFSFIIASLGLSLKVTSGFLYPIAISVSAVTTFTTPYLIRSADGLVIWLERTLPLRWLISLQTFRQASAGVSHTDEWRIFLRKSFLKLLANGAVVVAAFLIASRYVWSGLHSLTADPGLASVLSLALAFFFSSPFIWGFAFGTSEARGGIFEQEGYRSPLQVFMAARGLAAVFLVAILTRQFVVSGLIAVSVSLSLVFLVFALSKYIESIYMKFERRFVSNLHDRESSASRRPMPPLAPWDSHLARLKVSPDSPLTGKTLAEIMLREKFGVTVALIERGGRLIPAPDRNEELYPGDTLQVIGTDEQIHSFKQEVERVDTSPAASAFDYALLPVLVRPGAEFANKTIRDCGLREATRGLVVGIEKAGRRTLNPDSSTRIEVGDVLWIVGDRHLTSNLGRN
jgi:CPA2 family monovalent cation:H+ antiporter-2